MAKIKIVEFKEITCAINTFRDQVLHQKGLKVKKEIQLLI